MKSHINNQNAYLRNEILIVKNTTCNVSTANAQIKVYKNESIIKSEFV